MSDPAPVVFTADGTPVKVRVVGADCEGDVSGEGHYGYQNPELDDGDVTLYFEETADA